jgi:hypothetical protein
MYRGSVHLYSTERVTTRRHATSLGLIMNVYLSYFRTCNEWGLVSMHFPHKFNDINIHINTLCRQNIGLLDVKLAVRILTIELPKVKYNNVYLVLHSVMHRYRSVLY